ncbi:TPA: hypothetical protein LUC54_001959 [Acinetobacter baumannii]|uniref:Uncharacterized protein n=5 Tax=Acinetobacter TaxID=469 RepID=D0CE03_ACIB2|nr:MULTISPECIES: hypothetical protein [Acinetobacter]EME52652.1 hypothetical protein G347_17514 [Acinetobacter baumannii MSP4-16]ENU76820.1 hypothetical protein F976_02598 [Acinetobacter baumannii NIPH 1734]EXG35416.1 hypothetical protein J717_1646 [Acinetobacter baumannii 121738]MBJ9449131.1 hypothetical protein [Acinetobacter pittii]MBP1508436.1 hypothetical protein [Acinetobacter nosocomialis]
MKMINLSKILLITSLMGFSFHLSASPVPVYKGVPKTDSQFPQFLKKNHNQIVQLDLTIRNPAEFDDITYGYRGVSPTFYVAPLGKLNYEVYIDCDKIKHPNATTTIGQCAPYVKWNPQTGHLTGKFKVVSQGKNGMGSMLYNLIATP